MKKILILFAVCTTLLTNTKVSCGNLNTKKKLERIVTLIPSSVAALKLAHVTYELTGSTLASVAAFTVPYGIREIVVRGWCPSRRSHRRFVSVGNLFRVSKDVKELEKKPRKLNQEEDT
jgi:hypothetical protein